ncbi:uncharacterized protein LOC117102402 [Anneissia japonica]|uniref:uncharacterized protein LOC117102402 n=1 Tax=Anneissia japonica TaxID=1529436 RepID=UPI0014258BA4|nr:uncharacterized protein LOC117102402 [Anneissia japonica]
MCPECTPAISLHVACRFDLQPMIVEVLDVNVESTETQVEINVLSPMRSNFISNGSEIQSLLRYDQDPCQCPQILPLNLPYLMIPTLYIDNEPILDSGCYVAEFDSTLIYILKNLIESNEDCNKFFADIKSKLYTTGNNTTEIN